MIRAIRVRAARVRFESVLILQVVEDHDYGCDSNGSPESLSKTRTRDATPSDVIELTRLGYFSPKESK
jgi:hypothetical protein